MEKESIPLGATYWYICKMLDVEYLQLPCSDEVAQYKKELDEALKSDDSKG